MLVEEKYDIVYKKGKPSAVIIDIDEFEKMLENIEDKEDSDYITQIKEHEELRDFDSFLEDLSINV